MSEPQKDTELYEAAKNLALRMQAIEQDPDIVSVFSIARAHGYKTTSQFWQVELQKLATVLLAIDAKAKEAAAVVPVPAPAPVTESAPAS